MMWNGSQVRPYVKLAITAFTKKAELLLEAWHEISAFSYFAQHFV